MKKTLQIAAIMILTACAVAQNSSTPAKKISPAFSKVAIRALIEIRRNRHPKEIGDRLADVETAASTKAEDSVLDNLRNLVAALDLNSSLLKDKVEMVTAILELRATQHSDEPLTEENIQRELVKDPEAIALMKLLANADVCADAMKASLRNLDSRLPAVCKVVTATTGQGK